MKMSILKTLWKELSDVLVDSDDNIETAFKVPDYTFPKGTDKFEIWHWFDDRCPNNLHDDLMFTE